MTDVSLNVGDTVNYDFCPESKVVGVDRYTMRAFDGQTRHWDSYTLTSEDNGQFSRWWIVNVPDLGAHYYVAVEDKPEGCSFNNRLSGFVNLNSEGNSDLSSEFGALATYEYGKVLYAEEVFNGADRIVFAGYKMA